MVDIQSARRCAALAAFLAACSAAYADQPATVPSAPAHIALGIAPARLRAPYEVQILREDGETAPTYQLRDRYYVQGSAGERYVVRIVNPTPRRIEAVVTVDGLDVIDGENGDLRKRGYVVPAYGETRIEGFRTSTADVATFRFSSVGGSYAGLKGKARNVGVIAVALFEEQGFEPDPQIIYGERQRPRPRPYDYRDDLDRSAPSADAAPAAGRGWSKDESAADRAGSRRAAKASEAPATRPAPPSPTASSGNGAYAPPAEYDEGERIEPQGMVQPRRERLGLGTEFGEQRYSAVNYTRFVRAAGRPVAIAELRYNDAAGLVALGIPLEPLPGRREMMLRETANPFPGDRFARPPR